MGPPSFMDSLSSKVWFMARRNQSLDGVGEVFDYVTRGGEVLRMFYIYDRQRSPFWNARWDHVQTVISCAIPLPRWVATHRLWEHNHMVLRWFELLAVSFWCAWLRHSLTYTHTNLHKWQYSSNWLFTTLMEVIASFKGVWEIISHQKWWCGG